MIVEERTYHVYTGKLAEVVRLYAEEGTELQQRHLGNLVGAFTVDIGDLSSIVQMWGYESLDERARRRAALQADAAWKSFLDPPDAADPHAAQPHPAPHVLLPDPMSGRWRARSRSSPARRRASAARSPRASRRRARASWSPT